MSSNLDPQECNYADNVRNHLRRLPQMYHLKSRVVAKPLKDALELKSKMILPFKKPSPNNDAWRIMISKIGSFLTDHLCRLCQLVWSLPDSTTRVASSKIYSREMIYPRFWARKHESKTPHCRLENKGGVFSSVVHYYWH